MQQLNFNKPPRGAMLNPIHPLSKGMIAGYMFNEGTGTKLYNIVDRQTADSVLIGTGGNCHWGEGGFVSDPVSNNCTWFTVPVEGWALGTGPFTVLYGTSPAATQTAAWAPVLCWNNYSPAIYFYQGKVQVYGDMIFGDTDWRGQGYHDFAILRESIAVDKAVAYVDGEVLDVGRIQRNFTNSVIRFFWDGFSGENYRGTTHYIYLYNRALTQNEVIAIHKDPYCMARNPLNIQSIGSALISTTAPPTTINPTTLAPTTYGGVTYYGSATDEISLTDESESLLTLSSSVEDTIKLGDENLNSASFIYQLSDAIRFIESSVGGKTYIETLQDGILFLDNDSFDLIFSFTINDGIKLTDTLVAEFTMYDSVSDGISFDDSSDRTVVYSNIVVDGIKFSDIVSGARTMLMEVNSGISLNDVTIHVPPESDSINMVFNSLFPSTDAEEKQLGILVNVKIPGITFTVK
jgi:hypothetical protein